ncbi:MAG: hypothetical protein AB9873_08610 [Syntrophobacteraceae bacterium]
MMSIRAYPFVETGPVGEGPQDASRKGADPDFVSEYRELRSYTETLFAEYEKLQTAYARLREYVTSVETDRDEMNGQVTDLTEKLSTLESQATAAARTVQSVQEHTASWMEENSSKLEGYELMKKLLRGLFENADAVFTDVITLDQREKMCDLLNRLP